MEPADEGIHCTDQAGAAHLGGRARRAASVKRQGYQPTRAEACGVRERPQPQGAGVHAHKELI